MLLQLRIQLLNFFRLASFNEFDAVDMRWEAELTQLSNHADIAFFLKYYHEGGHSMKIAPRVIG